MAKTMMAREKILFFEALEAFLTLENTPFPDLAQRYRDYLDDAVEWDGTQPDGEYRELAMEHILGIPEAEARERERREQETA